MAKSDAARRRGSAGPSLRKAGESGESAPAESQHTADFNRGENAAAAEVENKLYPLPTDANAPLCAFCGERDADFLIVECGQRVPSCSECNEEWVLEEAKAAARQREFELTPEMPDRADIDF